MTSTSTLIFRFALVTIILVLIDYYAFQAVKAAGMRSSERTRLIINYSYWITSFLIIAAAFSSFWAFRNGYLSFPGTMKMAGILFTFLVAKLCVILFLAGEDTFRILQAVWTWVSNFFVDKPDPQLFESRRGFISKIALGVSAIPFAGMIYGMVKGKYDFMIKKETIYFSDLPDAFDGFTITQISDIHSGSFDDRPSVLRGLKMAQELKSDLMVFTGDLVNNVANEIEPWLKDMADLHAAFGKFSILGNHDYGDYVSWESVEAKDKNLRTLHEHHQTMGFRLLLNEAIPIEKDGHKISLVGVENWGVGFHKKGDLRMAMREVAPEDFKILLSHDPSHWEEEVRTHMHHVHLTLSGHTHGMQFGVELGGFKWSPVKYRYPRWAGLYEETGKYLYVNRGFGFLGFPGRVGIWPEITQITLKKK